MLPTRLWTLVVAAAASALVAWALVSATFADLPPLPWTLVPALALLGIGEFMLGRNLRTRLTGARGAKPVQPMAVPRVVALAKASSAAGAVFAGLAAGFVFYAIGALDKPAYRHDAIAAAVTAAAAIALTAAALYLERSCRANHPPDDDERDEPWSPDGHRGATR